MRNMLCRASMIWSEMMCNWNIKIRVSLSFIQHIYAFKIKIMSCNELCSTTKWIVFKNETWESITWNHCGVFYCRMHICVQTFEQNDHIFILWEKNANEWILINILIYNLHMKRKFNFLNHIYREAIFCATTKYLQKLLQNHMSISICAYVLVIGFWKLW